MGWKASFIAIKPANSSFSDEKILSELGYKGLKPEKPTDFSRVISPRDETKVYVGRYQDCLLICDANISEEVFRIKNKLSTIEQHLVFMFPKASIGIFHLHSVSSSWAYSIFEKGKKIRAKFGFADEGVLSDFGAPLPEEQPFSDNFFLNEEGERLFKTDDFEQGETEESLGEEFVFAVSSRFFGQPLDQAGDAVFDTQMKAFSFSSSVFTKPKSKIPFYVSLVVGFLVLQIIRQCMKQ